MKGFVAILILCSLAAGNFAWQLTSGNPQWGDAIERTYFQGVALLCYWLTIRFIVK